MEAVILDICKVPDSILRAECSPLGRVDLSDKELLENMEYTMLKSGGIGLAAPQIGLAKRMIVALDKKGRSFKIANPVIIKSWGSDVLIEGCLSIPNEKVEVLRNYRVIVEGINENNKVLKIKAKGLFARVLQHEIDHLEGKLITDYKEEV